MRMLLAGLAAVLTITAGATGAKADPWGYGPGPYYGGGYGGGYYRHHDRGFRGGDALLGGAIGLGVGALLGSALAQPRPAPGYVDPYYGRPVYAAPAYRAPAPVYVEPPSYRDTYPAPRTVRYYDRSPSGHVERCLARYRSYDPRTDTFVGYDGYERRCNL